MTFSIGRFIAAGILLLFLYGSAKAEGSCVGSKFCDACTDCSRCAHCSVPSQNCGVCAAEASDSTTTVNASLHDELFGYKLLQPRHSIPLLYGSPLEEKVHRGEVLEIYMLNDRTCEFVVGHLEKHPKVISSIQVTGSCPSMRPVNGIRLGSSAEELIARFGQPETVQELDNGAFFVGYGSKSNISFEVGDNKVWSMRIQLHEELLSADAEKATESLKTLSDAAKSDDFYRLTELVHPFVEFYADGQHQIIEQSFDEFRKNPNPRFKKGLEDLNLKLQSHVPRIDTRADVVWGIGVNFKFDAPCPIEKLTFMPYNGRYRLFEIWYRD